MIALLIIMTLAVSLGLLALRYGYDSRDGAHSQEEQFAAHGMRWRDPRDELLAQELAAKSRITREQQSAMHITTMHVQRHVPVTILQAYGELDASTYQELIATAKKVYDAGARSIVLDLSGISRMSSSGLVALHSIALLVRGEAPPDPEAGWDAFHAIAHDLGGGIQQQVALLNLQPQVAQALAQSGFTGFLEVYTDLDTALASLKPVAKPEQMRVAPPQAIPGTPNTARPSPAATGKPIGAFLHRLRHGSARGLTG